MCDVAAKKVAISGKVKGNFETYLKVHAVTIMHTAIINL